MRLAYAIEQHLWEPVQPSEPVPADDQARLLLAVLHGAAITSLAERHPLDGADLRWELLLPGFDLASPGQCLAALPQRLA